MTRLAVVDDDLVSSGALRTLLEEDGFEVTAFHSSTEALAHLSREHFDALITDLEMPKVHGLDLVLAARNLCPQMPILIVSGYASSPAADAALALGAKRVFAKPVMYDDLLAELRRDLGATATHQT